MLSGENSILSKATTAKENSDKSQIEERIKLAYHAALTEGKGSYTKDTLMNELEKEFKSDYDVDDSNDQNWKMKAHGQEVIIPAGKYDNTISFTITSNYDNSTKTYSAEPNMTFQEWIDIFSPEGITYQENGYIHLTDESMFCLWGQREDGYRLIPANDTITNGATYSFDFSD